MPMGHRWKIDDVDIIANDSEVWFVQDEKVCWTTRGAMVQLVKAESNPSRKGLQNSKSTLPATVAEANTVTVQGCVAFLSALYGSDIDSGKWT